MLRLACVLVLVGCAADPADPDPVGGGHGRPFDHTAPDHVLSMRAVAVEQALAWLDAELVARSPGTELSITFEDLETGERVALRGDTKHVSASSAKAWWVAAALDQVGITPVAPYSTPIFRDSDNSASGSVIDLIGPDAVNTWMWDVAVAAIDCEF